MDFAFYNEIGGRTFGAKALTPLQRMLRRVLRPVFFRLEELLRQFAAEQVSTQQEMADLAKRLTRAEQTINRLIERLMEADRSAGELAERLTTTEAGLAAAERELARLQQAQELARPLEADYNALADRVNRVEDRMIAGLATQPARAA